MTAPSISNIKRILIFPPVSIQRRREWQISQVCVPRQEDDWKLPVTKHDAACVAAEEQRCYFDFTGSLVVFPTSVCLLVAPGPQQDTDVSRQDEDGDGWNRTSWSKRPCVICSLVVPGPIGRTCECWMVWSWNYILWRRQRK